MKINQLSPCDAAYIAGLFDGEGSVYGKTFKVTQGVQGIHALHYLKEKIGAGCVTLHRPETGNWQAVYVYKLQSESGKNQLLKQLEPYLLIKT